MNTPSSFIKNSCLIVAITLVPLPAVSLAGDTDPDGVKLMLLHEDPEFKAALKEKSGGAENSTDWAVVCTAELLTLVGLLFGKPEESRIIVRESPRVTGVLEIIVSPSVMNVTIINGIPTAYWIKGANITATITSLTSKKLRTLAGLPLDRPVGPLQNDSKSIYRHAHKPGYIRITV
jgi:hypothetical protein